MAKRHLYAFLLSCSSSLRLALVSGVSLFLEATFFARWFRPLGAGFIWIFYLVELVVSALEISSKYHRPFGAACWLPALSSSELLPVQLGFRWPSPAFADHPALICFLYILLVILSLRAGCLGPPHEHMRALGLKEKMPQKGDSSHTPIYTPHPCALAQAALLAISEQRYVTPRASTTTALPTSRRVALWSITSPQRTSLFGKVWSAQIHCIPLASFFMEFGSSRHKN